MKKNVAVANLCFLALFLLTLHTGVYEVASKIPFWVVIILCEVFFLCILYKNRHEIQKAKSACDIAILVFIGLFIWELATTQTGFANKVLVPCPENVFMVFVTQRKLMIRGLFSSLQLLAIGFAIALTLGIFLGLLVGWIERLRNTFFPIAKVLSPIPPIIYTPYIIAIMPTFRSASAMVIILGIFWPTFLNMIIRVNSIDRHIINSAKAMCTNNFDMIFRVLLPYVFPGILSSLKVTLSTSFMILTIAEMMGATSGLGYFIKNYSDYGNYTNVVAGIFMVGIVITLLNKLLSMLEHRFVKWKA